MEPRLILCPGCARHVFSDVDACPFCARPRATSAASLAAAVVVSGALLVSCSSSPQPDTTPTAEPPPTAEPTAEPPPDGVPAAMYAAPAPSTDERIPAPVPQPPDQTQNPPVAPMYGPPPKQNDNR